MLGELDKLDQATKNRWARYFDTFQSKDDGLFRDPTVSNRLYEQCDWWGARHLIPQILPAYAALGCQPAYKLRYLEHYKNNFNWLEQIDWSSSFSHENDIDNKIMNILCALQFERDFHKDKKAASALIYYKNYLQNKLDNDTALWGKIDFSDRNSFSRSVQFAYHIYLISHYDNDAINSKKLIDHALRTQNEIGGFGVEVNSSACEDIDSIEFLCRLAKLHNYRKSEIKLSLNRALIWLLANQNDDGGFVFRLNEPFLYGHPAMSSKKNQSAMFPTWFRTLTIVYISNFLKLSNFKLLKCPGYQF
jgi:hypothetical protein